MNLNGKLLIATPNLRDPNFAKTVIAIVNYSKEGTTGLVLNTPVDTKNRPDIQMAWINMFGHQSEYKMDRLYIGGPVPCNLMLAHNCPNFSDTEIAPGTYVTTDRKSLTEIVQRSDVSFRCFAGYAGWSSGQLEAELMHGSWYVVNNTSDSMFYDCEPNEFWERQVSAWGKDVLANALQIDPSSFPKDPSLN